MEKCTKPMKIGTETLKRDNKKPEYKQDLEEIKQLLVQMNNLLEKLLDVLPFKK